jgi:hypothetical protein
LFGVSAFDAATYVAVVEVFLLAVLASAAPAMASFSASIQPQPSGE